ncbi:winged helix-turn-helix transcriptional regulator [Methanococcus sp. CF]
MISALAKKNSRAVLELLAKNEDGLHFGDIKKELGIDGRVLTDTLNAFLDFGLVTRIIEDESKRMSRVFYKITVRGIEALNLYKYSDEIQAGKFDEKKPDNVSISHNDNKNNQGFQIIGNNIQNLHVKK